MKRHFCVVSSMASSLLRGTSGINQMEATTALMKELGHMACSNQSNRGGGGTARQKGKQNGANRCWNKGSRDGDSGSVLKMRDKRYLDNTGTRCFQLSPMLLPKAHRLPQPSRTSRLTGTVPARVSGALQCARHIGRRLLASPNPTIDITGPPLGHLGARPHQASIPLPSWAVRSDLPNCG